MSNNVNKITVKRSIPKNQFFIASDHAGFLLKQFLIKKNPDQGWKDLGVHNEKKSNYARIAQMLCCKIKKENHKGVLICGSGQGMAMAANRFSGIRAAAVWNVKSARLAREHNNANVLCLGARLISRKMAHQILQIFINSSFKKGRHLERIKQIDRWRNS